MKVQENREQSPKTPVVVLIRVSSLAQSEDDKFGIPAQKAKCAGIVRNHNLFVVKEFQIEGVSGSAVLRSPMMQEVLHMVRNGLCQGIVLAEESRLMRPDNPEDSGHIIGALKRNKVKLYLSDGIIDLNNASNKLYAGIKFEFADYERQVIRDRTLGGRRAKRARGEWPSGNKTVPYGLKLVNENRRSLLAVDEAEIGYVVMLFNLFVGGLNNYEELSRRTGIPYNRIKYILQNEIYTGWHVPKRVIDPERNQYKADGTLRYQNHVVVPEEQRERFFMLEDAPISAKVFAKAQELLKLKRNMRWMGANTEHDPYVYRGFLRCAECGQRMITIQYKNKEKNDFHAEYYACRSIHPQNRNRKSRRKVVELKHCGSRRIRRSLIEQELDKLVLARFGNVRMLGELMETRKKAVGKKSTQQQIAQWQAAIAKAEKAVENLTILFAEGDLTREKYNEAKQRYVKEKAVAEEALRNIEPDLNSIDPEFWSEYALEFKEWHNLDTPEKRRLLSTIAPVFQVAGLPGEGYHETVIKIKGCMMNLTAETAKAQAKKKGNELVVVDCQGRLAPNYNQPSIYIEF